jgi:hypothetical protein
MVRRTWWKTKRWNTNLAVSDDDHFGLPRVVLLGSSTVELSQNVGGHNLSVLWGFGSLLLLHPVYHVANGINVGVRRKLERLLDLDLSPWCQRTGT